LFVRSLSPRLPLSLYHSPLLTKSPLSSCRHASSIKSIVGVLFFQQCRLDFFPFLSMGGLFPFGFCLAVGEGCGLRGPSPLGFFSPLGPTFFSFAGFTFTVVFEVQAVPFPQRASRLRFFLSPPAASFPFPLSESLSRFENHSGLTCPVFVFYLRRPDLPYTSFLNFLTCCRADVLSFFPSSSSFCTDTNMAKSQFSRLPFYTATLFSRLA